METTSKKTEQPSGLPSAYDLAMLAATMNKAPEDALRLWLQTQKLLNLVALLSEGQRREALRIFASEESGKTSRSFKDCTTFVGAYNRVPLAEAMTKIGISTSKTFEKLVRQKLKLNIDAGSMTFRGCSEEEINKRVDEMVRKGIEDFQSNGVSDWWIGDLKTIAQRNKEETGRMNQKRKKSRKAGRGKRGNGVK